MNLPSDYSIALNYLPLTQQDFSFSIYRKISHGEKKEEMPEECYEYTLPVEDSTRNYEQKERNKYWILFEQEEEFTAFNVNCLDNRFLTERFLFQCLRNKVEYSLQREQFNIENGFRKRIEFIIKEHTGLGSETVWIEPYYLGSNKSFGFLVDFRFKKDHNASFSRKIQQLSLSLDQKGHRNRNFNIDKYNKVQHLLKTQLSRLFPIQIQDISTIDIETTLQSLDASLLDVKNYIFGNDKRDISQFRGIRNNGPYKKPDTDHIQYLFIYLEQHIGYAKDLLLALRGERYSGTFPGYESMFRVKFDNDRIAGIPIKDYSRESFEEVLQKLKNYNADRILPIIIIPSRDKKENENIYYTAKYIFVKEQIPIQIVTLDVLRNKEKLKWSVANIALQIFAKIGGYPWKVDPKHQNCLIVGIGNCHNICRTNSGTKVNKFFAYSVLTDSSGLYLDLEVLSKTEDSGQNLVQLRQNLRHIIDKYKEQYQYTKIVIHAPYKVRKDELKEIENLLRDIDHNDIEFVVLKVNEYHKYFGYYTNVSSLVPFESSYVRLTWKEYLIWFEGLQYHNSNAVKLYSAPNHIEFYYESRELNDDERLAYLQDALNLSGANWRGFNSKSSLVSTYYCKIVADFVKHFQHQGFEDYNIKNFAPWFI